QRRRDNTPLRGSSLSGEPIRVFEIPTFQPLLKDVCVHRYMSKHPSMIDMVKAAFDVSFKNPLRSIASCQYIEALFDSICRRAASSETVRVMIRIGFSDGFQSHEMQSLHGPIFHRGNTERS